ncbi:cytochrome P450 [Plantactinospora sp. WMMC1484]|uniref:cytochrome P450 n=1 Tax=Plantactinospora sp. WMMC1484 TaxID=3404122 RepID=UPI003BF4B17A
MVVAAPTGVFQPLDPAFQADPYPCYRRLRDAAPILKDGVTQFVASRHEIVAHLLRSEGVRSDWPEPFQSLRMGDGPAKDFLLRVVLHREGPQHLLLRQVLGAGMRIMSPAATARRIAEHTDRILDEALASGELDLVSGLAVPIPVAISCDLLGVPEADQPLIRDWGMETIKAFTMILPEQDRPGVSAAIDHLRAYIRQAWDDPLGHPLGTALATLDTAAGGAFDRDETVDNIVFLLVSGFTTTVHLLANMFGAFLEHPDQWRRLKAEPSLVGAAVEEVARYDAPIQYISRQVAERMEIGGETLRPNRVVHLLLGAANRDERVFADPDRFDIGRQPNPHLGFGAGRHICLGAGLGRAEARGVLDRLVARCATLEPDGPLVRKPMQVFRSYERLPARVRPC